MTSTEYKTLAAMITLSAAHDFAFALCHENSYDPAERYFKTETSKVLTGKTKTTLYIDSAVNLLRRALFMGAPKKDILDISKYVMVITMAMPRQLNYELAKEELKIKAYEQKYSRNNFLSMKATPGQIFTMLKQNPYGVPLEVVYENN
jgi:hypothetical protein